MTGDQKRALVFLDDFFASAAHSKNPHGASFAALKGYAGVGKTWLIAHWIERLLNKQPNLRIVVTAPTNKAVDVLRSKCGHLPVEFRTLDSYLGFRVKRDDDWKMQRSRNGKADDSEKPDLVIVDEGSMVKAEYHAELKYRGVPVLYVGDPAQLQPVGEDLSEALRVEPSFLMVEPTRQAADSPIHGLTDFLRSRVEDNRMFTIHDIRAFSLKGDGRFVFTNHKNVYDWADTAIDNGMDARILAFTNAAVNDHNANMHKRRYPNDPLFGSGELALVNEAFEYDDETLLCNGELLRVSGCKEAAPIADVRVFEVTANKLASNLQVDGETVGVEMRLQVPLFPDHALQVHRTLTDGIYTARREGRMADADKLLEVRRPLNKLAPLRHSFANTVHKSQGSTYDVAFCDFPDIYRSRDMRARLLYVGSSRPSQFLVMSHSGA